MTGAETSAGIVAAVIVLLTAMIGYLTREVFKGVEEQRELNRTLRSLDDEIARMDRVIMTQAREIEVCRAAFTAACQEEKA